MSRTAYRTLLSMALGALLGLPCLFGCADNRSTLFIAGVLAKTEDCTVTFDPGQARIGRGLMDRQFAGSYTPPLLVGNQMVPQGNNNQLRTETSRITLEGAEVRLTEVESGAEVRAFTTPISGVVNPTPATAPGFYGAHVMLIPPAGAGGAVADGEYVAQVRVYGVTLGGQDVESGEFRFPIEVCTGCSIFFSSDSIAAGACVPGSGTPVGSCRPGEDGPTDCTVCQRIIGPNSCNP